jgi:hypothetical protein
MAGRGMIQSGRPRSEFDRAPTNLHRMRFSAVGSQQEDGAPFGQPQRRVRCVLLNPGNSSGDELPVGQAGGIEGGSSNLSVTMTSRRRSRVVSTSSLHFRGSLEA